MSAKRKNKRWKPKNPPWWGWAHTGTATAICAGIGMVIAGPFGAAIGLGIGLIVSWAMNRYLKNNYGITVTNKSNSTVSSSAKNINNNASQEKISKIKYLGNSNTMELHDLSNIQSACRIDFMKDEHKVDFENVQSAISAGYNGCRWCLEEYHTD